jgi:hypothetical protein
MLAFGDSVAGDGIWGKVVYFLGWRCRTEKRQNRKEEEGGDMSSFLCGAIVKRAVACQYSSRKAICAAELTTCSQYTDMYLEAHSVTYWYLAGKKSSQGSRNDLHFEVNSTCFSPEC